jgi:hypothetical protein
MDGDVEEGLGDGGVGLVLGVESGGEVLEIGLALADDDLGLSVETGDEGVLRGGGFARDGAGAGGLLRIATVGVDLELRGHRRCCFEGSRRDWGNRGGRGVAWWQERS